MAPTTLRATEQRNPRTRGLAAKSTREILRAIHGEDLRVAAAVTPALPAIADAVEAMVRALERNARIFYVGAGTSGRLATLDAAELPPTFGTSPQQVQAIIAGGRIALTRAVEGAEDNRAQGARDFAARGLNRHDVVIGITASGLTPYVLGALAFARKRGALTVGITSNRGTPLGRLVRIAIVTPTGPEAITGSTRLKAGTSQKMVLNLLSTAAMIRLGRVHDNWMMGVALTNQKLRERGLRILMEATGATAQRARHALRQAEHDLGVALVMLKTGQDVRDSRSRLRVANGNLRDALTASKGIEKKERVTGRA